MESEGTSAWEKGETGRDAAGAGLILEDAMDRGINGRFGDLVDDGLPLTSRVSRAASCEGSEVCGRSPAEGGHWPPVTGDEEVTGSVWGGRAAFNWGSELR